MFQQQIGIRKYFVTHVAALKERSSARAIGLQNAAEIENCLHHIHQLYDIGANSFWNLTSGIPENKRNTHEIFEECRHFMGNTKTANEFTMIALRVDDSVVKNSQALKLSDTYSYLIVNIANLAAIHSHSARQIIFRHVHFVGVNTRTGPCEKARPRVLCRQKTDAGPDSYWLEKKIVATGMAINEIQTTIGKPLGGVPFRTLFQHSAIPCLLIRRMSCPDLKDDILTFII